MNYHRHYQRLVQRYLNNTATKEELALFFQYLEQGVLDPYLTDTAFCEKEQQPAAPLKKAYSLLFRIIPYAVAASFVLVIASVVVMLNQPKEPVQQAKTSAATVLPQVQPGTTKAILTLSNGETVMLDNQPKTIRDNNAQLVQKGDVLTYQSSVTSAEISFNTIATPRGGEYRVTLPDGTNVWLNAGSLLRYPTAFSGDRRVVELTGEAFFDVAKNSQQPFFVQSGSAVVKVTGTRFNVKAYEDEKVFKTTLEEGAVTLIKGGEEKALQPGEGGTITEGSDKITVSAANVEKDLAWKNGFFQFDKTELAVIMKQIGRWYDLDIRYKGAVPKIRFMGRISRHTNLSDVLAVLQLSEVKFSLSGKTLTVEE